MTKVILRATRANPADGYLEELEKEIELPFVPFVGLRLILDPDSGSDHHATLYQKLLAEFGPIVNPVFTVENVAYSVGWGKFLVDSALKVSDAGNFDAAIAEMVFGYGFTTYASRRESMEEIINRF